MAAPAMQRQTRRRATGPRMPAWSVPSAVAVSTHLIVARQGPFAGGCAPLAAHLAASDGAAQAFLTAAAAGSVAGICRLRWATC
jgi:hypothetical protein